MAPVNYSSMGFALPAAIGAALALRAAAAEGGSAASGCSESARLAVACVGDGALRMTGPELASAVRAGLPLVVVVLSDGELGMMSGLQRAGGGSTYKTILHGFDAAQLARAVGAAHRRACSEAELEEAATWAAAHAAAHGPVLLDVA
eukprot:88762-Prymnesium_polylepis.1